jgi:hypothetical protein
MSFWETVFNIGTGGLSNAFGKTHDNSGLSEGLNYLNPLSPIMSGGKRMVEGDFWGGIDRALDMPGGEQGPIDYGTRSVGDVLPDSIRSKAKTLGTTIGGLVGSYVPVIGTAAGAAIGSGIGSKLQGGTTNKTYGKDFLNAGVSYLTAAAAGSTLSGGETAGAGDALAGGLTAEELALLGPEYAQPGAMGLDTGGFEGLDLTGTVQPTISPNMPASSQVDPTLSAPAAEPSWVDKTYNFAKDNSGKLVDVAKMLLPTEEGQTLGAYATEGSYSETGMGGEEVAMMRRLSSEGTSGASKAKNLYGLDAQKKPKSYDMSSLLNELLNYKKKEGFQYVG